MTQQRIQSLMSIKTYYYPILLFWKNQPLPIRLRIISIRLTGCSTAI